MSARRDRARRSRRRSKTRGDREPGLSAEGWFYADHQVYPYGNHLAVVKVDRDTGGVKVERYVIGYDIGRAINPTLVKGQIVGGFAQGLGGALMEEFTYNERGDPLAATFADYLMPTVREMPEVEIILREDYPARSIRSASRARARAASTAVGAAIASAIDDAIGMPGAITQLPVTPQRLKAISERHGQLVASSGTARSAGPGSGHATIAVWKPDFARFARARMTG